MKSSIGNLRLGQQVWASVEEIVDQDKVVVNFDGDFLPVVNSTESSLMRGQKIQLIVESLDPLRFRLINRTRAGWRA